MKKSPEQTNAMRSLESDSSLSRASANTCAGDSAEGAETRYAAVVSLKDISALKPPQRLPSRPRAETGCCFQDAREGAGPSRILREPGTPPDNSCKHRWAPCILRSRCEFASSIRQHCRVPSSSNRSDSSPSGRKEVQWLGSRSPHIPSHRYTEKESALFSACASAFRERRRRTVFRSLRVRDACYRASPESSRAARVAGESSFGRTRDGAP